jgi:hypothetical protein
VTRYGWAFLVAGNCTRYRAVRTGQRTNQRNADTLVVRVLANPCRLHAGGIEVHPIVTRLGADPLEDVGQVHECGWPEAEQINIARRPVRLIESQVEEQRAHQQELICPWRHAHSIQQPFQVISRQDQVEVGPLSACAVWRQKNIYLLILSF